MKKKKINKFEKKKAPEKMKCKKYSYEVDTFAWGVCMIELITLASVALDREKTNDYKFNWEVIEDAIPNDCPKGYKEISIKACEYFEKDRPSISLVESQMKEIYSNDIQNLPPLSKNMCIDPQLLDQKKPKRATMIGEIPDLDQFTPKKRERFLFF